MHASASSSRSAAAAEVEAPITQIKDDEMGVSTDIDAEGLEEIFRAVGAGITAPVSHGASAKELRAPETTAKRDISPVSDDGSLRHQWKKTKTSGKGVELLDKVGLLFDGTSKPERTGFLQVRLAAPREEKKSRKPPKKKDGDKNLRFEACSPEVQRGLRKSRVTEWQEWKRVNAGII